MTISGARAGSDKIVGSSPSLPAVPSLSVPAGSVTSVVEPFVPSRAGSDPVSDVSATGGSGLPLASKSGAVGSGSPLASVATAVESVVAVLETEPAAISAGART